MDSSTPQYSTGCQFHQHHPVPHHHHHHYFDALPHCPLHSYMLHLKNQHSPTCHVFASSHPSSQNPQTPLSFIPPPITLNLQVSASKDSGFNPPALVHRENEELEGEEHQQLYEEEEEEEEEEDPVFVLTDEWKEFFAKSEAKRRLAKKQARKKGKNMAEQ